MFGGMHARELQACGDGLEEFLSRLLREVGRSERRHHGALYVQGLLRDGERKSIEPLAQRVPGGNVQALQPFVGQSPWAWEPVRPLLAQQMEEELLPGAGWIVDDTGFPKQGQESVGVARRGRSAHEGLLLEPARGGLTPTPGAAGQTPLAGGTELPAVERGTGIGSLRRTRLAGLASSRHARLPRLRLSAAGEAAA
jgi:hypothetical protein